MDDLGTKKKVFTVPCKRCLMPIEFPFEVKTPKFCENCYLVKNDINPELRVPSKLLLRGSS